MERVAKISLVLLIGAYICLFLFAPGPYLGDFSYWMYQGHIAYLKVFPGGGHDLSQFCFKSYPVPNAFHTAVLALLNVGAGPIWAGKIFLCLYIILFCCSALIVSRLFQDDTKYFRTLLLVAIVALAQTFWWGYVNYHFGIVFLMFYFYLERTRRTNALSMILISLLIFFTHGLPFLCFVLMFSYHQLVIKRDIKKLLCLVPTFALSVWYLYGRSLFLQLDQPVLASPIQMKPITFVAMKFNTLIKLGLFRNVVLENGSSYFQDKPVVFMLLFIVNLCIVALIYWTIFRQLLVRRGTGVSWAAYIPFLFMAACFVFFPPSFLGIADFGFRLLVIGFLFLFFFVDIRMVNKTVQVALLSMTIAFAMINVYQFSSVYFGSETAQRATPSRLVRIGNLKQINLARRFVRCPVFSYKEYHMYMRNGDYDQNLVWQTGILYDCRDKKPAAVSQ